MGRASSKKRIARAARAAGRDTGPKHRKALAWPLAMVAVVGMGGTLIFLSRGGQALAEAPILGDHWHAAAGIYVCNEFRPAPNSVKQDTSGIHTHGDGLMHMEPFSTRYTGKGANLQAWLAGVDMEIETDRLTVAPDEVRSNGDDCGGEPGLVQVKVWENDADQQGRLLEGDLGGYAPPDGSLFTIAFAPDGADLPKPPSVADLPAAGAQPGADPAPPPPTTVPADGSTTSAPEGASSPDDTTDLDSSSPSTSAPDTTSTSVAE